VREIKKRKKQGAVDVRRAPLGAGTDVLQADRFKNVSIEAIYNFEAPSSPPANPPTPEPYWAKS